MKVGPVPLPGSSTAREATELGIDSFRGIPLTDPVHADSMEESSSQEVSPQNNESISGRIYSLFRFIIHLIYIRFGGLKYPCRCRPETGGCHRFASD